MPEEQITKVEGPSGSASAAEIALTGTQPTPGPNSLASVNPLASVSQMEGFEDAVISPAQMVLIQPTSRDENAVPGTFKDTITGQSYKEMKIVPLKIVANTPGMPRVLFQEGAALGSDPICRSNDGITPAANAQAPQAEFCKNCKHSSWKNFAATKKPPACKEKAKLLFVERESGLPFMITFGGRCVTPVKNLLKTLMRLALLSTNQGVKVGLFDFCTKMALDRKTDAKGTYFVVKFLDTARVANVGEFGPLYQELVKARDVLSKAEDEPTAGIEADVLGTPAPAGEQVHDAEVVDDSSDIPF